MWGGKWKSISSCLKLDKAPQRNQVVSESVNGNAENFALEWFNKSCEVCVEEDEHFCKCKTIEADEDFSIAASGIHIGDNHVKANSSFAHSVINMVGMLIGLGQLSTPYALENGGWTTAFFLVGMGVACAYTSHILGKCLKDDNSSRNYPDIGQQAFGTKGRVLVATFIYMEIFMALVSYTISLSDNLGTVFAGTKLDLSWLHPHMSTPQFLTLLAVLVALPSLWLRDLSSISFLSSVGILMSLLIFMTVACTAAFGGVKANQTIPALQLSNIPLVSGLYIFSFSGHIVFPNIYKSMKDPSKFTRVSIVSFMIVTTLYTSLAFMGAKMFGPQVNSQITLSMPPHLILTKIALWATVLTPMTKYALEFAPIAMQLEHSLPCTMSSRMRMLIRGSIGSLLLLGILILALSVPYFEYVLGLTGSLVGTTICIILPCTLYMKIFWLQIPKPALALNFFLLVLAVTFGVIGTISSTRSLIQSMQIGHSN